MGIARFLIGMVDGIMANARADDNFPRSGFKAFGAGVIEGMVDGAILVYLINVACNIIKNTRKK